MSISGSYPEGILPAHILHFDIKLFVLEYHGDHVLITLCCGNHKKRMLVDIHNEVYVQIVVAPQVVEEIDVYCLNSVQQLLLNLCQLRRSLELARGLRLVHFFVSRQHLV